MVCRAGAVPRLEKSAPPDGKLIAAVGVADLQSRSGHRLAFGHDELQRPLAMLCHEEQCHGLELHRHLYRQPGSDLSVIHPKRTQLGLAACNTRTATTIVPHQQHVDHEVSWTIPGKDLPAPTQSRLFIACTFLISKSPATGMTRAVNKLFPTMIELEVSSFSGTPTHL